jgi:hypothetical protein
VSRHHPSVLSLLEPSPSMQLDIGVLMESLVREKQNDSISAWLLLFLSSQMSLFDSTGSLVTENQMYIDVHALRG